MNSFILYLLEASLVLVLLYGAYRLLLSKETFFAFNRFFLMAILVLAMLLPLVSFEVDQSNESFISQQGTELGKARNAYHLTFDSWSEWPAEPEGQKATWWQQFWAKDWGFWSVTMTLATVIYGIGLLFCVARFSLAYVKIYLLKRRLGATDFEGLKVMEIPANMAPFSFLNTVFIPDSIDDEAEYSQILAHEKTHIQQKHSIDLIFVQLVAAVLWFNPVVWLLIKSLKQTHEYIADKNMLRQGFSLVEYQSLLLRQLISNNSLGLVHNFNLSFIKKRITMMSIKESGWKGWSKAVAVLSVILLIGAMTVQSNTMLGGAESTNPVPAPARYGAQEIRFFVDNIPLFRGLQIAKAKDYEGEFRFKLDNDKLDELKVGLDLLRKGKVVANLTQELKEGDVFDISALLQKAQQEDYLVVDIIEGPDDAVKLYNIPLFRESAAWKKSGNDDLPPLPPVPPVTLYLNEAELSPNQKVDLAELRKGELAYVLSEFIDFDVVSRQAGPVTVTLVRKDKSVRAIDGATVKRRAKIDIKSLAGLAKSGDLIMVQLGKPDGLRFGTQFYIK